MQCFEEDLPRRVQQSQKERRRKGLDEQTDDIVEEGVRQAWLARHTKALREVLVVGLPIALATGVAFGLAFYFAPALFSLLTDHREILESVEASRAWLLAVLVFSSFAYLVDGYFLGLAAGPTLRKAMVKSLLIAFLPLALYARYGGGGVPWLWGALVAFMFARTLTLGLEVPKTLKLYD